MNNATNPVASVHFSGLNAVRCLAACGVVLAHIEGFKQKAQLPNLMHLPFISNIGTQSVKVFFVLSGFLITYLLLAEQHTRGAIHTRNFYVRRVLRIWPLYFMVVFLGFFVFPALWIPPYFGDGVEPHFALKLLLMLVMLPNVVYLYFGHIFGVGVLWSIGTEEQFYLAMPFALRRGVGRFWKDLWRILFIILAIKTAAMFLLWSDKHHDYLQFTDFQRKIIWGIQRLLEYDCMLVGCMTAYIYFHRQQKILKWIYAKKTLIGALTILLLLHAVAPPLPVIENVVYSSLYAVVLLNIATNSDSILQMRSRILDRLGQISYGIYMYHSFVVALAIYLVQRWLPVAGVGLQMILLYVLSFGGTFLVAALSYRYIEKPLLRLKAAFAVVHSKDTDSSD